MFRTTACVPVASASAMAPVLLAGPARGSPPARLPLVWQKLGRCVLGNLNVQKRRSIRLQRPQPGRAAYSTGISMLRRKNRRLRFLTENVLLQTGRNILVEPRNL